MQYDREYAGAIQSPDRAAKLYEQIRQSSELARLDKADRSPITIADFAAQDLWVKFAGGL